MLSNMKPKTNKEVCAGYQGRKRDRNDAADRRRTAARTRRQSKREQPAEPSGAVAAWAAKRLKVPVGHDRAGEALALPAFAVSFFRAVLETACHLGYLLVSRKNAKSTSLACLILAYLADGGPLRRAGFRACIVSITKLKAGELRRQIQDIAEASGLRGLSFPKSPAPGRVLSRWGSCEILSAQDYEGHASGFDLVLIDELGLLGERYRPLINGLRSSLTAKRGRMICLSIRGDSPFTTEALALSTHPGVVVHHHAATAHDCELDDEVQLRAANPGVESGVLRMEDLVRDARLVKGTAGVLNCRLRPSPRTPWRGTPSLPAGNTTATLLRKLEAQLTSEAAFKPARVLGAGFSLHPSSGSKSRMGSRQPGSWSSRSERSRATRSRSIAARSGGSSPRGPSSFSENSASLFVRLSASRLI